VGIPTILLFEDGGIKREKYVMIKKSLPTSLAYPQTGFGRGRSPAPGGIHKVG